MREFRTQGSVKGAGGNPCLYSARGRSALAFWAKVVSHQAFSAILDQYVRDTPLADVVEVRTAEVSLADLKANQQTLIQILNDIKLPTATGINLEGNQVQIYITNRTLFDDALREADIYLSDHVEVITVYEPPEGDFPFAVTPEPTIHFPQLKAHSVTVMAALLEGDLLLEDRCLRVKGNDENSILIIWQPGYFVNNNAGIIEILDGNGEVVAKVGERIRLGGGETHLTKNLVGQLQEPLSERCEGPYWLMGDLISN